MTDVFSLKKAGIKALFVLVFISTFIVSYGQEEQFNYFYRIYFTDKGEYSTSDFSASQLLSEKALNRRTRAEIPVPDTRDLPVFHGYLSGISSLGLTLHCTSKWMNTGLFKTSLPYVADVKMVKNPAGKSDHADKLDFPTEMADYPPYDGDSVISVGAGTFIHKIIKLSN